MKIKRLLASILLLAMVFSSTIVLAQDMNEAEEFGYDDGRAYVLEEYRRGAEKEDIPAEPELPDIEDIEYDYRSYLNRLTEAQKDRFFEDYERGYVEGYKDRREDLFGSDDDDEETPETKTNYADSLGTSLGEIAGYDDYYSGSRSNWSRAIPSNSQITSMFNLSRETSQYRSAFLSEFRTSFQEAYEEAFEYGLLNTKDVILNSAVTNGKDVGLVLGSIYGAKDYAENRSYNVDRDLPSDRTIISDYLLTKTLDEYEEGFLSGFKIGYEEGYTDAFYNSFKEAIESGRVAGQRKGELMATQDYVGNKTMSWSRHKSLESAISAEYRLIYLANVYEDSFLNAFWTGFAEKYEETYKALTSGKVNEKIAFDIITIAGGMVGGADNSIAIEVESGTFYNDVSLSIERVFNEKYNINENRYIKASDIYNIQVSNPSKNINNSKPVIIAMEYYGKYDGGIYKWANNRWNYVSSIVEDGIIMAEISPSTLDAGDNLYGIFIDRNYDVITDIRSHWAKDEIDTLIRRNIINGYPDGTFKPNRNISRAEFLALLSRVYEWKLPSSTNNIQNFADHEVFYNFYNMDKLISYALGAGYIRGYEDNTFRPERPISYSEIEIIMGRVLKDPSFRWHDTAARILYEKLAKSNSYDSMNHPITRAEVAYMLYILNQWRY